MTPGQAIRDGYANYARFSGRASRPAFGWFLAFCLGGYVVLQIGPVRITPVLSPLAPLFLLVLAVPLAAVATRRMRDADRAPVWLLLPVAVALVWLVITAMTLASVLAVRSDPLDDGLAFVVASCVAGFVNIVALARLFSPSQGGIAPQPPKPNEVPQ